MNEEFDQAIENVLKMVRANVKMDEALKFSQAALNLSQAKIETLATNDVGKHLYPKLGFREVARQVHYVMPLE